MQKALALGQLCYNAALLPGDEREELLAAVRPSLGLNDEEFEDFRRSVFEPMVDRHEQMFPRTPERALASTSEPRAAAPTKKLTVERYAPCPCGSGKKYKFCCGTKTR